MDGKNLKYKNFHNIAIYGKVNSGKCCLAKSLTFSCQNFDSPYNFTYKQNNFFILPIPCSSFEFQEKYELSSIMTEIALIVVDAEEAFNNPESLKEYDLHNLILDLSHKGIKKFIVCLNKIDKFEMNREVYKKIIEDLKIDLSFYQNNFNKNIVDILYIPISAKESINIDENTDNLYSWYEGDSLLVSLRKIAEKEFSHEENKNKFMIYDLYKDEDYFVISGKVLNGNFRINEDYKILPINKNIKLHKICDCEGQYVDIVYENQFVSFKLDLNIVSSDEISRGDLITKINEEDSKNIDLLYPKFNTFEADVYFYGSEGYLPNIISSGFTCFVNFNLLDLNCCMDNIIGEYGKYMKNNFLNICKQI